MPNSPELVGKTCVFNRKYSYDYCWIYYKN